LISIILCGCAEELGDHKVILDDQSRLLPWASYDNILDWSMNFLKSCPSESTPLGDAPWYLITASLNKDGTFWANDQNDQGSNAYWAVETCRKYYAYTGDRESLEPAKQLLDRVLYFHTPRNWAWPDVPRTQDDTTDGMYTDEWSGVDKICMVGVAYVTFYKVTGQRKYLDAAIRLGDTVLEHLREGDADHSPLPFRVDLKTGSILAEYTSSMTPPVILFGELARLGPEVKSESLRAARDAIIKWILDYPVRNSNWTAFYEDVGNNHTGNMNQNNPMETARFLLDHPELDPVYLDHVPALIQWVRDRFGQTRHFGATSIREQDVCFKEMGSHTARYAGVVAKWFGVTQDPTHREEAGRAFALATYSACNRYSRDSIAVNSTGLGYYRPWFVDSYFDYISHFIVGMAEMPEMAPEGEDHFLGTTDFVKQIDYSPGRIEYHTFGRKGDDILRLSFQPVVFAGNEPLPLSQWSYGRWRDVPGVLRVHRFEENHIVISKQ